MVRLERATGVSCIVAGAAWVAACLVHNLQPQGCIGNACAGGTPMRGQGPVGLALLLLAGVMLAASLGGLVLMARRRGGQRRLGTSAASICAAGLTVLLAAGVVSTFVDPDWDGMPWLVGPGILALVLGLVLLAVLLWQARLVPNRLLGAVLVSVVLLPFANEQTSLILLAVPFGLALAAVGAHLVRRLPGEVVVTEPRGAELA